MDLFGWESRVRFLRKLGYEADAIITNHEKYSLKIQDIKKRIEGYNAITWALTASKLEQKITSQKNPEQPSPSLVQVLRHASGLDPEFISPQGTLSEQNAQRWQELTAHVAEKLYVLYANAFLLDKGLAQGLGDEKFRHALSFMFRHVDDLTLRVMAQKMERVQTPASGHQTTVNTLLTAEAKRRLTQTRHTIQKLYTDFDPKTLAVGFYNLCATLYGHRDRKLVGSPDLMQQEPSAIMEWVYGFGVLADPIRTTELKPSVRYQDQARSDLQQKARDDLKKWLGIQHDRHWYGKKPARLAESPSAAPASLGGWRGWRGWLSRVLHR